MKLKLMKTCVIAILVLFMVACCCGKETTINPEPETNRSSETFPTVKNQPDFVVYEGEYPAWPCVTQLMDGSYVVVFREGTAHGFSSSGKVLLSRSIDSGNSWSDPEVVIDNADIDDRNPSISQLKDSTLIVSFNTYVEMTDGQNESIAYIVRSLDSGKTWTAPVTVDNKDTRTRGTVIEMSNGELLIPIYGVDHICSKATISSDNGETWQSFPVPNLGEIIGDEWSVIEDTPGHLLGMIRGYPIEDHTYMWKTESNDFGRSWTTPEPTNVELTIPCPGQLFLWQDKVHMVYSNKRGYSVSVITVDDPDFIQWNLSEAMTTFIYFTSGKPMGDSGYPSIAPLQDSKFMIVDYEINHQRRGIYGYIVDLKDIRANLASELPQKNYTSSSFSTGIASPWYVGDRFYGRGYHTNWLSGDGPLPHWIKIDLAQSQPIFGVTISMLDLFGSDNIEVQISDDDFNQDIRSVANGISITGMEDTIKREDIPLYGMNGRWVQIIFHSPLKEYINVTEIEVWAES